MVSIMDSAVDLQTNSSFFGLPREIRDMIYTELLDLHDYVHYPRDGSMTKMIIDLPVSCKRAHQECVDVYYKNAVIHLDKFRHCVSLLATGLMEKPHLLRNLTFVFFCWEIPNFGDELTQDHN